MVKLLLELKAASKLQVLADMPTLTDVLGSWSADVRLSVGLKIGHPQITWFFTWFFTWFTTKHDINMFHYFFPITLHKIAINWINIICNHPQIASDPNFRPLLYVALPRIH